MTCSEARMAANRRNAERSTGPTTAEGKAISRRNGLKHGLSGEGIVRSEQDAEEVDRRSEALAADMKPKSMAGVLLIAQMATLSVRAERASVQESAALAMRVRHAVDDFDEERIDRAAKLFESLADDPRNMLRKLKKSPEGVQRLVDAWLDLRADLSTDPEPTWAATQLEQAANLTGLKAHHASGSRIGALSKAFWGDFSALDEADGKGLAPEVRQAWAKSAIFKRIDAEIAALEDHYLTLDFETIELDRTESGARALFDPSKPACLARRYGSEANRGFFRALKEFRRVEAEFEAQAEAAPTSSIPVASGPSLGSSREKSSPPASEPTASSPETPARDSSGRFDRLGDPIPHDRRE